MKKILIITDVDFWNGGAGHRIRISALVAYLAKSFHLSVFYFGNKRNRLPSEIALSFNIEFLTVAERALHDISECVNVLAKELDLSVFNFVIIEYIHNSLFVNSFPHETRVILDAHDLVSIRTEDFSKHGFSGQEFELSRDEEAVLLDAYDYIIVLTQEDVEDLRELSACSEVILSPHPSKAKIRKRTWPIRRIGFIASEYLPNLDGIEHFLKNCWPEILKTVNAELYIFGNISKALGPMPEKVYIMGYFEDIEKCYDYVDMLINPVRFGAGLKIKTIEGLASGLPMVVTRHASRGLANHNEKICLVADNDQEFISYVIRLTNDEQLGALLTSNAFQFIKSYYSPEQCFKTLADILNN